MKYFITIILSMILSLSFSQKMVYHTKSLSISAIVDGESKEWSKPLDVNIVLILDIDSTDLGVNRKVFIFSEEYKEFDLGDFKYSYDEKSYLIKFDAHSVFDDMYCIVAFYTVKKKAYILIKYDDFIVKYLLNNEISISNMPKSKM